MNGNLFTTIEAAIADPARPFLHADGRKTLSYGDMLETSARYANLLASLGVKPGDRVAVQTDKHVDSVWFYLGCLRAGAVYLPLNPAYTPAEVSYFADDAEPGLVVCEPGSLATLRSTLGAAVSRIETLDAAGTGTLQQLVRDMPATFNTVVAGPDDLAAILYTSGTTGRSKGAMITHENLRSNAMSLVESWRFSAGDVLLHALPIFHTHGLFVAINTVMLSGASMIYLPKFDIDAVMAALPRATTMMGVPTFYTRLLADNRFDRAAASHMRLFVSGSAPLSAETHRGFTARTGHAILERYGMTETNMITSNPYDGERRPGAVGFALPGITVRIADPETGTPLPQGEVGVIEIEGPNVFSGYWRMPEKTEQEFRPDGFFITGDLGYVDPEGYFTISGRAKDLIISGGFNVYPAEVENALDALQSIGESAVIGLPHADFGEAVTAVVTARPGRTVDESAIRGELESVLAKFKIPKRVLVKDALPRNAMGKIQKNALREEFAGLYTV
ncbi:malonyl-CoA synthase [Aminobacter aganoensis]|uniref:Malonyl-CoA/methylmalonyl-CoA synthetase n=1 Tax=Aminobacter aganoensis TaxID=83264 RepID=A0A7X0KL99_9HYPH|nr:MULTISPECIES: malonyl-CoA synthase [Aminobacter]KQU76480.1 malonyl-CoA synthase [Aminobacter sp. DSM 101952]MBB6354838.1 malonyl-CoA/methylmalonyl-CoA synthetase [Aminobacter aganoensis]